MIKISLSGIDAEFKRIDSEMSKQSLAKPVSDIVRELEEATPVDTGFAKASWVAVDNVIFNTAEYIEKLNTGSSKQAPAHFIEEICLKHGRAIGMIVEVRPDH